MRIVLLSLATLIVATPAWADWGPTKWGMDRDATIAAAGKGAVAVSGKSDQRVVGQDWRAKRPSMFEGIAVEEDFYFDLATGGLSLVRLQPARTDCPAFIAAVRKRYPKPIVDDKETFATGRGLILGRVTWTDQTANLAMMMTIVQFSDQPTPYLCQITYEPYAKRERASDGETM